MKRKIQFEIVGTIEIDAETMEEAMEIIQSLDVDMLVDGSESCLITISEADKEVH